MKLSVNAPLKGADIVDVLEKYKEGDVSFKFVSKTGLRYDFEVSGIEGTAAVDLAKKIIKGTPFGRALYFSVSV